MSFEAHERKDGGASLLSKPQRLPWLDKAACAEVPLSVFFPPDNVSHFDGALAICARCPVMTECREWTDRMEKQPLNLDRVFGVFGGETPKQRVRRRRAERAAANGART